MRNVLFIFSAILLPVLSGAQPSQFKSLYGIYRAGAFSNNSHRNFAEFGDMDELPVGSGNFYKNINYGDIEFRLTARALRTGNPLLSFLTIQGGKNVFQSSIHSGLVPASNSPKIFGVLIDQDAVFTEEVTHSYEIGCSAEVI